MEESPGGGAAKQAPEEEGEWEYYDDNEVLPDFWQYFVDKDLDFKKPFSVWENYFTKQYEKGYGFNIYREFWRVWVPLLLAPRHGTTSVDSASEIEERRVQEILLDSLEQFICGNSKVEEVFSMLASEDSPPPVCGHVFNNGDTCYNCRDCGQDATCVLCFTCFNNSPHKNHRYRMHTSEGGGGFCDCGDPEAFTSHSTCSIHSAQVEAGVRVRTSAEVAGGFPESVRERARDVFYNVGSYCMDIVCDPKSQTDLVSAKKERELFPDLKFPLMYSSYCVVLLNDENHSYNEVIRVLTKVLPKASQKTISDLTTYVDKHGKAVIKVGDYRECSLISQRIDSLTRIPHSSILKSKVVPSYIVAHERFVSYLLQWIPTLFQRSTGFRALFSEVLLSNTSETSVQLVRNGESSRHCLCEAVLLNDLNSWKQIRGLWLKLLIDGLMKDYDTKKDLAVIFTRNYPNIVNDYIVDDQERDSSITALSVQIFTVPSLSTYLIEHCDALAKLVEAFHSLLRENLNEDDQLSLTPWLEEERSEFERGLSTLNDITYLLSQPPSSEAWTSGLRSHFTQGLDKILEILALMQGMDSMKRQLGHHVELEDTTWKLAFELQNCFREVVRLLLGWIATDRAVLTAATTRCLALIVASTTEADRDHPPTQLAKSLTFLGGPTRVFEVWDYDVAAKPVSLHTPLHRFLVHLLVRFTDSPAALLKRVQNEVVVASREGESGLGVMLDHVLRAVVTVAQINVGMWRRNGNLAESQAFLYNSRKYCPGVREADLLMLQLGAALAPDIDTFLVTVLARFRLAKWVTGELDTAEEPPASVVRGEDFVEKCNGLADQWLSWLIAVVGERFAEGMLELSQNKETGGKGSVAGGVALAALRRDALHVLCIEPQTHSSVMKKLPEFRGDTGFGLDLDQVLEEIAELRPCTKSGGNKRVYHLKPGLDREYNMYYISYTREQQTMAMENQLATRKKSRTTAGAGQSNPVDDSCCPPPVLPRLSQLFAGLARVLRSDVVLQACSVTLRRATAAAGRSKYVTDTHIHKVLFILALGLRQEEEEEKVASRGESREFSQKCGAAGLWDAVRALTANRADLAEHVVELAAWCLARAGVVAATSPSKRGSTSSHVPMDTSETGGSSSGGGDPASADRKRRAEAIAARKAKILAQMSAMQKNFANENRSLLEGINRDESEEGGDSSSNSMGASQEERMAREEAGGGGGQKEAKVCLGPAQTENKPQTQRSQRQVYTCILCQEEEVIGGWSSSSTPSNLPSLVLASYIQRSTVLSQLPWWNVDLRASGRSGDLYSQAAPRVGQHHLAVERACGPHVSTCGHAMHAACFQKYFESQVAKERDRTQHTIMVRSQNYDVSMGEYVCPICERLSNTVLPVVEPLACLRQRLLAEDAATGGEGLTTAASTEIGLLTFLKSLKSVADGGYVNPAKEKKKKKKKNGEDDDEDDEEEEVVKSGEDSVANLPFLRIDTRTHLKDLGPEVASIFPLGGGAVAGKGRRGRTASATTTTSFSSSPMNGGGSVFSGPMQEMMSVFGQGLLINSLGLEPDEEDHRVPLLGLQSAAFTLLSVERWLALGSEDESRGTRRYLFGGLNPREEDAVRYLVRYVASLPARYARGLETQSPSSGVPNRQAKGWNRMNVLRSNSLYLLSVVFGERRHHPDSTTAAAATIFLSHLDEVLKLDAFGLLVSLVVSLPCTYIEPTATAAAAAAAAKYVSGFLPTGRGHELHCVKICLMVHCVQVLCGYPEKRFVQFAGSSSRTANKVSDDGSSSPHVLARIVGLIAAERGYSLFKDGGGRRVNVERLATVLETDVVPFLRACALFFRYYTDVPPGWDLLPPDSGGGGGRDMSYPALAHYLGLPDTLLQLLDTPAADYLVNAMLFSGSGSAVPSSDDPSTAHHHQLPALPSFPLNFRRSLCPSLAYPLEPEVWAGWRGGLVPLPRDYTVLMNAAAGFHCNNSVTGESKHPALCLLCGTIVCSHSHCCEKVVAEEGGAATTGGRSASRGLKVGGSTAHARICGADTGIFLKIRDCCIVVHSKIYRGAFLPAPYIDEYGEADQGLRRGNPLYLDTDKYEQLNRMWLRGEIPEKICRSYDPDILILVDWQTL